MHHDNALKVLALSGKGELTIRFENVEEEKLLPLCTQLVHEGSTEKVLEKLQAVGHYGVVHISKNRTIVRLPKESLKAARGVLFPNEPQVAACPEVQGRRRWIVHDVPLKLSPLAVSEALRNTMGWKQFAGGSYKRSQKKMAQEVHILSDEPPTSTTVLIEDRVCLIKELGAKQPWPQAQMKVSPPEVKMDESSEEAEACRMTIVEKKIAQGMKAATEALAYEAAASSTKHDYGGSG